MWMELNNVTGGAVSLPSVLHGFMPVCLATKTLASCWGEVIPQGLVPTRAVQRGPQKCGVYSCRSTVACSATEQGTAPVKREGMWRPETVTVNTLKDPCLLLYSLLHSLNLPLRGTACLPFQSWVRGSKAKTVSISLSVFLWLEVALHVTYPLSKRPCYSHYTFRFGYF